MNPPLPLGLTVPTICHLGSSYSLATFYKVGRGGGKWFYVFDITRPARDEYVKVDVIFHLHSNTLMDMDTF